MMRPGAGRSRSAALARAQAHLSRKRVPGRGLQEERARQTPTPWDLLSSSSSSDNNHIHSASRLTHGLVHVSEPRLARQGRGDLARDHLETKPSAQPQSRFLKQKTQAVATGELDPTPKTGRAVAFKERPSVVLRKVAQIESQFHGRKTRPETKQTTGMEDELSWTESSLKVKETPEGFSDLKGMARPKDDTKSQWKMKLLPGDKAPTKSSRPLLDESSLSSPRRNVSSPESSRPVSRSIIRSLDELFSDAADTQSEASAASDFRVNVLSLDELASVVASEEELKEAVTVESAGEPGLKPVSHVLVLPVTQSTFNAWKPSNGNAEDLEDDDDSKDPGEADISERLSCTSAGFSSDHPKASPSGTDYSEDFEPSSSSATPGETEREPSTSSAGHSSRSDLSSHGSLKPPRRSVRDAAVQTGFSFPTHPGVQSDILPPGQTPRGGTIDTSPAARLLLSLDVLEAVSTYSPAALALNDVLRQSALLVRRFVEANRQLHAALVASLEEETFHYHTLEEAKRYIGRRKAPRLNTEQTSN